MASSLHAQLATLGRALSSLPEPSRQEIIEIYRIELIKQHELKTAEIGLRRRGQTFAFCSFTVAIMVAGGLIAAGRELSGGLLGGVTITAVVSLFLTGRRQLLRGDVYAELPNDLANGSQGNPRKLSPLPPHSPQV